MEQVLNPPSKCLCDAERVGVQNNLAAYECGTVLLLRDDGTFEVQESGCRIVMRVKLKLKDRE